MLKVKKEFYSPFYTIDNKLLDLVSQIENLLKKLKINEDICLSPIGYREKYETDSPKVDYKKAYELIDQMDVFNKNDLFKINSLLVNKQITDFRQTKIYGRDLNHDIMSVEYSDPELIQELLNKLNSWYVDCKDHILIKSCAYIFSFINIHPFSDGNGRTSRYILTSLMSKYDKRLKYFPYEELLNDRWVRKFQIKLYQDLYKTDPSKTGDNCYRLIYFFLSVLRNKLKEVVTGVKPKNVFN